MPPTIFTATPVGPRIRDRRLARGLTQVALAGCAGISASYLNLIEHDRRAIGGGLLTRLAEALETDRATLSGEGDGPLIAAIRAAGAARGLDADALESAADLVRLHPGWARLIAAQAEAVEAGARSLAALTDRVTHDPGLAEALHELLSTVSVVRSTAAILAQTPGIDRNWLGRFHANLDADSRRLADGAQAVMALLDRPAGAAPDALLPAEAAARALDARRRNLSADLPKEFARTIATTIPCADAEDPARLPDASADPTSLDLPDGPARDIATAILRADAEDAARLPDALVAMADGPDDLAEAAGGDLALVLRRMALAVPGRGLLVCDAAGALLRRVAVEGFALPRDGSGCPLWPLHAAFSQPGRPLTTVIETPDGAFWRAYAVASPVTPPRFGAVPVLRATMLLMRATAPGPADPVGPGCRLCPRAGCPARREPSAVV